MGEVCIKQMSSSLTVHNTFIGLHERKDDDSINSSTNALAGEFMQKNTIPHHVKGFQIYKAIVLVTKLPSWV